MVRGSVLLFACLVPAALHAQSTKISGELPRDLGGSVWHFQLTPDGRSVVYMADQEVHRNFELYSVPADGSEEPRRLSGDEGTLDFFPSFRLSPDGQFAAYYAEFRTWWVPIDGSAPPLELDTPPPVASMGDTDRCFHIAPGNRWLLFWNDNEGGLWGVPTDGGPGQRLDGGVNYVPFVRAFVPDGEHVVYVKSGQLWNAALDGSGEVVLGPIDGGFPYLISVTSDGAHVVYTSEHEVPDRRELYAVPADGSAPPLKLNDPLVDEGDVRRFLVSPDGATVVYNADQDLDTVYELYSVPTAGGSPFKLHPPHLVPFDGDIQDDFAISPDSRRVVFRSNRGPTNDQLYSSPLRRPAGRLRISAPLVAGGGVRGFVITPDGRSVVYRADQRSDEVDELFVASIDQGLRRHIRPSEPIPVRRISGDLVAGGDVDFFDVTGDSRHAVFLADAEQDETFELYSAPLAGGVAPVKLSAPIEAGDFLDRVDVAGTQVAYRGPQSDTTASGRGIFGAPADGSAVAQPLNPMLALTAPVGDVHAWKISPDGRRTVYLADQDTDDVDELYSVPTGGGAAPVKLNEPLLPGQDVLDFDITTDGSAVLFVAGGEVRRVPILGGAVQTLTALGDVTEVTAGPDGIHAVLLTETGLLGEIYSVRIDGSLPPSLLSSPTENSGRTRSFKFTPDGTRVVFSSNERTVFYRLSSSAIDGSSGPTEISLVSNLASDMAEDYVVTASRVLFRVSSPFPNATDLFSAPADGMFSAVLVNGTSNPSRDVTEFVVSPDGARVAYIADQETDQLFEAFGAPAVGGPQNALNTLVAGRGTYAIWFTPDSSRVLYLADQDVENVSELYSVLPTGGPASKVNSPLTEPFLARVSAVAFDPESNFVVFGVREGVGLLELQRGSITGDRPPVLLADPPGSNLAMLQVAFGQVLYVPDFLSLTLHRVPLAGNGRVTTPSAPTNDLDRFSPFTISPRGNRVVYRSDAESPGAFELYSAPLRSQPLEGDTPTDFVVR